MKKRKRLFWRLYPSYLLITLVSLMMVSAVTTLSIRDRFLDQIADDLEARARLLEVLFERNHSPLHYGVTDELCRAAGEHSETRITVIAPSGEVLCESHEASAEMESHGNRPEFLKAMAGQVGRSVRYSSTLNQEMMYVAVLMRNPARPLAVIRTALPVGPIDVMLRAIQIRKLLFALFIAILAAGVSLYISRRISRPIEEMRRGAEEYAAGNLSYRLPTPVSQEMFELAHAMNRMAVDLCQRMQTVTRQRNEQEAVLTSMKEGLVAVDLDERVINVNPAASRMFLARPSDLLGRTIQEMIRNPDFHRFVRQALSEESSLTREIIFYHAGETIMDTHSSVLRDENGERIGIVIVFHDITQLRRLENIRREFAANVSHEIKTPLTAIKGFVETLRDGAVDNPDEAARFLEIIDRHATRLNTIIDDLMRLSQIEQQEQAGLRLSREPVRPVLENILGLCEGQAAEKNIDLELTCGEDLTGCIDGAFLEQAVANLVDNAIKYSPPDRVVRLSATRAGDRAVIRIQDEGIGIAAEHLPRLFERFYRVEKSRSRKQGGTGLGLAIVKHIVQAHGGHITVESTPGQGSCFDIHLPDCPG